MGLGKVPAATLRHNVGALNGRGATTLSAFFELRTSCDSRTNPLSGSASKTDWWMVAFATIMMLAAIGDLRVVSFLETEAVVMLNSKIATHSR